MIKTIVLTIVLLGFAMIALGVKVLFVKGGRFPSGHHHLPKDKSKNRK